MLALALLPLAFFSPLVAASHQDHRGHVVHRRAPHVERHLEKRIDTGTTYLPNIIALTTPSCDSTPILGAIGTCAALSTDQEIAICSCAMSTLATVYKTATCIVNDPANTSGAQALYQYNGFVAQCISVGFAASSALASVAPVTATLLSTAPLVYQATGTVIPSTAGQATGTVIPSTAVYQATATVVPTTTVPAAGVLSATTPTIIPSITLTLGNLSFGTTTSTTPSSIQSSAASSSPSSSSSPASSQSSSPASSAPSSSASSSQSTAGARNLGVGALGFLVAGAAILLL